MIIRPIRGRRFCMRTKLANHFFHIRIIPYFGITQVLIYPDYLSLLMCR